MTFSSPVATKECSNYHSVALIAHASKVTLKILQGKFQQYMNYELPDVQAGFRKGREEPEIKLPTSVGSSKEQESSRKTSASLTTPKPLTMWITTNCGKLLKRWEYQTTCLLRNLYVGEVTTVRTGQRITNWFQIRKGVYQGCTLSLRLFNLM